MGHPLLAAPELGLDLLQILYLAAYPGVIFQAKRGQLDAEIHELGLALDQLNLNALDLLLNVS